MLNLIGVELSVKKNKSKHSISKKEDRIKEYIHEWNIIKDVELYKDLYKLCSQLFFETQNKKLACLNYYIDHEKDNENSDEITVMYAEIKDTWELPLKERYNQHKDLLKRVMSNDTTLIYCSDIEVQSDEGQLSLFG